MLYETEILEPTNLAGDVTLVYVITVAMELHSNLFIYPSSIHEVLVLPDEGTRKQRAKLKEMVEEVNETNVSPEERLSNSVYYFDREKQEVTIDYLGKPLSELNR